MEGGKRRRVEKGKDLSTCFEESHALRGGANTTSTCILSRIFTFLIECTDWWMENSMNGSSIRERAIQVTDRNEIHPFRPIGPISIRELFSISTMVH